MTSSGPYLPWQQAWQQALYGDQGFYRRPEGPAGHFRTACHAAAPVLAGALAALATEAGCSAIVDVGAGRGELLTALADAEAAAGLRLHGVDVVERPDGLPERIGWSAGLPDLPDGALDGALVTAWELLDVVPMPIAEVGKDGGLRLVLVEPATGDERPGPPLTALESSWCARWWPGVDAEPGSRVEIGAPRDALWAGLVKRVARTSTGGLLLAVDYRHDVERRPAEGSLAAFRSGRAVPPVPDGSCDLTAHVALDAVAVAGEFAGASASVLLRQREALRARGVAITPGDLATARSAGTAALLAQLERRSQLDELLDANGLGGFGWLVQGVRRPVPAALLRHT